MNNIVDFHKDLYFKVKRGGSSYILPKSMVTDIKAYEPKEHESCFPYELVKAGTVKKRLFRKDYVYHEDTYVFNGPSWYESEKETYTPEELVKAMKRKYNDSPTPMSAEVLTAINFSPDVNAIYYNKETNRICRKPVIEISFNGTDMKYTSTFDTEDEMDDFISAYLGDNAELVK